MLMLAACVSWDPSVGGEQIGLDVMRERMSSVGGELLVRGAIGDGVEVVARAVVLR